MTPDLISFTLFSFSSLLIVVNPIGAMLIYQAITEMMDRSTKRRVIAYACRLSLVVLFFFAIVGTALLQLFGITIDAFTIAGGILLFCIGIDMVYAKTSRTKVTATEKYESIEAEDVSSMPLAFPMIAGPGSITTVIVLSQNAKLSGVYDPIMLLIILFSILLTLLITYFTLRFSDPITARIGQREYRVINRLMGIMLMAIAVQFIINGISSAFPGLA
ncbi:MAG: MarC family protein [Methanospirillaceae archaeon]|nr:MarC family protein [Methanospirillaceae archaeon]